MELPPNLPRDSVEEDEALLSLTESVYDALPKATKKPWVLLVILIFIMIAFIDVGAYLAEAPLTRLYEANLCLKYYREQDPSVIAGDGSIPEQLCKVDVVQQRLASVFGWQEMFSALPGILLAVPYGTWADKVGRKWIFIASLVGIELGFVWVLLICKKAGIKSQTTMLTCSQVTSSLSLCS
jgi:MFS family permease